MIMKSIPELFHLSVITKREGIRDMYCEDCSMYDHWTGFCYWFRNYPSPVEGAGCVRNNKKEEER